MFRLPYAVHIAVKALEQEVDYILGRGLTADSRGHLCLYVCPEHVYRRGVRLELHTVFSSLTDDLRLLKLHLRESGITTP